MNLELIVVKIAAWNKVLFSKQQPGLKTQKNYETEKSCSVFKKLKNRNQKKNIKSNWTTQIKYRKTKLKKVFVSEIHKGLCNKELNSFRLSN